jgi:hypothetical protein
VERCRSTDLSALEPGWWHSNSSRKVTIFIPANLRREFIFLSKNYGGLFMSDNKGCKKCSHCGKEKPFSEFGKNSRSRDGLEYECRQCRSELHQAWYYGPNYEKNKEYVRKYEKRNYRKLKRNELKALLKIAEDGVTSFEKNVNLDNLTSGTYVALTDVVRTIEEWLK